MFQLHDWSFQDLLCNRRKIFSASLAKFTQSIGQSALQLLVEQFSHSLPTKKMNEGISHSSNFCSPHKL